MSVLPQRVAVGVFLAFAFAYFLSALLRAVTATLAPTLAQEFVLHTADLGLLSGGNFLGIAVLGCLMFSLATGFTGLLAGRVLCGVGVSVCLMAPLSGFRRWLTAAAQLRANAWMMTGSLGMVASTLPAQWLLPLAGWRPLFWGLAMLLLLAMVWLAVRVPAWHSTGAAVVQNPVPQPPPSHGYAAVWRDRYFQRIAPSGFCTYGGMVAMPTLWAGPWMQQVTGYSALESATGLFWINVSMLCAFWAWAWAATGCNAGACAPLDGCGPAWQFAGDGLADRHGRASRRGYVGAVLRELHVCCAVAARLGTGFSVRTGGRALSAYNLVIFLGVFVVQWGIGLLVDALIARGATPVAAFRWAMGFYWACNGGAYVWFRLRWRGDNLGHTAAP